MRSRHFAAASVVGLSLALTLASVHGQRVVSRNRVARNGRASSVQTAYPKQMLTPANPVVGGLVVRNDVAPAPWVTVCWGLNLDHNTQALYQQMATSVSGYTAIPNDRPNYYSAVINSVTGWGGMVTDVQPANGGGYLVTVSVVPFLTTAQFGDATTISSDYSELYNVDVNNQVTYAGFLDPDGSAGKAPDMVGD